MAAEDEGASLDWETHETQIRNLFISQNKTWKEVAAIMSETQQFTATERQYKYRFPGLKNVKEDEWAYIEEEIRSRAAAGKLSLPCLHDQPLPMSRVSRGIARARIARSGITKQSSPQSRQRHLQNGRITVRTPPPLWSKLAPPSPTDQQMLDEPPRGADHGVATCSSLRAQGSPTVTEGLGALFDFEAASSIGNLAFTWETSGPFAADVPITFGRTPSPMRLESDATSALPVWVHSSGHHDSQSWSPSIRESPAQFLADCTTFDFTDTLHQSLTANLPWFQVLGAIEGEPDHRGLCLDIAPAARVHGSHGTASSNSLIERRKMLSDLLGFPAQSVVEFSTRLQGYIPERRDGDLPRTLEQILDPSANALPALFALIAYFATNNSLNKSKMDGFLKWATEHQHLSFLQQFMALQLPTIHAFAKHVFESAIRIKSVPLLSELLDRGVDFGSVAQDIVSIGDHAFTRRVLMKIDPKYFKEDVGSSLFHQFVSTGLFDLAKILLDNGVSVDVRSSSGGNTALFVAACYGGIERVQFLTEAGADILASCAWNSYDRENGNNPIARATSRGRADIVALMLKHNPNRGLTGEIHGKPVIQWASLHCKQICELLLKHAATESPAVLLGDLFDAAVMGGQEWTAYVQKHSNGIPNSQLEQVLEECIKSSRFAAAATLLVHGVDPNGPTLTKRPIKTALDLKRLEYVELLLKHKVKLTETGLLYLAVRFPGVGALKMLLPHCTDPRERMKALVTAVTLSSNHKLAQAYIQILLRSGVNVDTPGLRLNPLQSAAGEGDVKMVSFLLQRGAGVNAAAFDCGGRTALQAALGGESPMKLARILLRKKADILAPPAIVDGRTPLEAFCHSCSDEAMEGSRSEMFFGELLDAGAEVNRPDGEPSSVLHGLISKSWHKTLARCLEPRYHTIADHLWRDEEFSEEDPELYKTLTPTQLAASEGDMEALKMLLEYGTSVNEPPGDDFGRTALQAACEQEIGPAKTELVDFLLDQGADVNAEAGLECGVTALQAAAITGDIKLVELLISKGADVNAMASLEQGRYAIEGAAEHGRLDTVKMLLNAGAKGNLELGTGFEYAIELAEENGHFAVANMLKTEGPDYLAMFV
ncbi:ankyrin repeat-containing domain protein [Immersiella caudata]|uniref:Ankyrin repeat-containing domain protein n=1 Tax=Immersiella caudata TaxID=314043 RepID=A0AA40BXA7_9PEZI|nr:ankyrin repeat-containing domain protein [Immersiella caudata]